MSQTKMITTVLNGKIVTINISENDGVADASINKLKDKEFQILALNDKSVVYTMSNWDLNDDDFEYMGFTQVYGITNRTEPIRGRYYCIGSGEYLVTSKDGIAIIRKSWDEDYNIEVKNNCLVVIQVSKSGIWYIKYG
jgi:hypothetical protein